MYTKACSILNDGANGFTEAPGTANIRSYSGASQPTTRWKYPHQQSWMPMSKL